MVYRFLTIVSRFLTIKMGFTNTSGMLPRWLPATSLWWGEHTHCVCPLVRWLWIGRAFWLFALTSFDILMEVAGTGSAKLVKQHVLISWLLMATFTSPLKGRSTRRSISRGNDTHSTWLQRGHGAMRLKYLVGGLEHYFPRNIGLLSSSQVTNSYFSEGWVQTTTNQVWFYYWFLQNIIMLFKRKPLFWDMWTVCFDPQINGDGSQSDARKLEWLGFLLETQWIKTGDVMEVMVIWYDIYDIWWGYMMYIWCIIWHMMIYDMMYHLAYGDIWWSFNFM